MEFNELSILIVGASVAGLGAMFMKQPLIVGYLFAGAVLSSLNLISGTSGLESLGQIGVTLLLFLLGLEMNLKEISTVGKAALFTGLGQIIVTFTLGLVLCIVLGFGFVAAGYISIALTFSSTIIVVKLLSEKKDLRSLYGRISVGFLLVQDFVAILILMFLSSLGKGGTGELGEYVIVMVKALVLFVVTWVLTKKIMPFVFDRIVGKSTELTFILSIAWALGFSTFTAGVMGLTLEIGGFLAGLTLSSTGEHLQIAGRAKPLRDFFLTIFFLLLGARLGFSSDVVNLVPQAITLSLFVLLVNPLIVMAIMGFLGYKKRTSFMASMSTAQISEFSLIIMSMGAHLGYLTQQHVSLVTLIGVVTMTISTYLILGAGNIFKRLSRYLSVFERRVTKEGAFVFKTGLKNHIVLVGCDRTGMKIFEYLSKKYPGKFVVIDFNPAVFTSLTNKNAPVVFGDIEDVEIMEASNLKECGLLVSTTSDMESNLSVLEYMKSKNPSAPLIFTATSRGDGVKLYEKGASFVVIPEMIAGAYMKHLIGKFQGNPQGLAEKGKNQFDKIIFEPGI